jgi:GT2 family glycosyltransferase
MAFYSAYVPCYNNYKTIGTALCSLRDQIIPPSQIFLVDDNSFDDSVSIAHHLGFFVYSMAINSGRGAVRARSMELADYEYVACCDATNFLPPDYVARALAWFEDSRVAAVCGPISQQHAKSLADRWRGRHLFKISASMSLQHHAPLSTYGCVIRASAVHSVGNYNPLFRHSEDVDLGRRLLDSGFDVIFDPELCVYSSVSNTILEVLERYWRWYAGPDEIVSFFGYAKQVWYSIRIMVLHDLRDGDLASVPISLVCPHYQFWRSYFRSARN